MTPRTQSGNGGGPGGRRRLRPAEGSGCAAAFLALAVFSGSVSAQSTFFDTRAILSGVSGPSLPSIASAYYNPAALILLPGHHAHAEGAIALRSGSIQLNAIDTQGRPTDSLGPKSSFSDLYARFYVGASTDLGVDGVVLSLAVHTPASVKHTLPGASSSGFVDPEALGPGREHLAQLGLFHLYMTPSVAFRIVDQLAVGVSFTYVYARTRFAFAGDAALRGGSQRDSAAERPIAPEYVALDDCGAAGRCGYGADAAAEGIRVEGSSGALGFGVGGLIRPTPTLNIGVGYHSPIFAISGGEISSRGEAWVHRARAAVENAAASSPDAPPAQRIRGRGTLRYLLPGFIATGVTWSAAPRLALNAQLRWTDASAMDALDIRLTGAAIRDPPPVPDRIVHSLGHQDLFSFGSGAILRAAESLELQASLLVVSPSVPREAVSALVIGGWTLDTLLAARWMPLDYLTISLGYNLIAMPSVTVRDSLFDPSALVACVDGFFDIDLPACRSADAGRGLASTAGRYSLWRHRLALGASLDLW